jgi:hypothetical protein
VGYRSAQRGRSKHGVFGLRRPNGEEANSAGAKPRVLVVSKRLVSVATRSNDA